MPPTTEATQAGLLGYSWQVTLAAIVAAVLVVMLGGGILIYCWRRRRRAGGHERLETIDDFSSSIDSEDLFDDL